MPRSPTVYWRAVWRARVVRHDADHAFHQEQLRAVMHFVFLHAKQHLEAGLAAHGQRDPLIPDP
ncbi:MAG: hypothetical protein Q8O42_22270 [Acidobacteriota bacterium]|nr:hypothetical protein [Acidobacteriota bacterium]